MTLLCADCHAPIARKPGRPGRLPHRCAACVGPHRRRMEAAARQRRREGIAPACLDCGASIPPRPGKRPPKRCDRCRPAHLTRWHAAYRAAKQVAA